MPSAVGADVPLGFASPFVSSYQGLSSSFTSQPPPPSRSSKLFLSKSKKAEWIDLFNPPPSSSFSFSSSLPSLVTPPRSGHASFVSDGVAYVFGGYAEEWLTKDTEKPQPHRYVLNDLWKFDPCAVPSDDSISCWPWIRMKQTGEEDEEEGEDTPPPPRLASACAVVNGMPTLFGGWDPQIPGTGGIILDTVHQLDLSTVTWKLGLGPVSGGPLRIPEGPTSRHIALSLPSINTSDGNGLTGRVLLHNHRCIDHVLLLEQPFDATAGQCCQFRKQETTGSHPSSRGLHTGAVLDGGQFVVVFGGAAKDGVMSGETFLLDVKSWHWTLIDFRKMENSRKREKEAPPVPSPRAGACMAALDERSALLFGGAETAPSGLRGRADLWLLTVDPLKGTGRWELLIDEEGENDGSSVLPPARNAATLNRIDRPRCLKLDEIGIDDDEDHDDARYFVLHGGWAPFKKTYSDVYVLRVRKDLQKKFE